MTWALLALGLAAGADWRRLALASTAIVFPLPVVVLIAAHYWRSRPDLSMRPAWFCDAVASELRSGASLRLALESAAVSVEAAEVVDACRREASIPEVAGAVANVFPEIGAEVRALVTGTGGMGIRPAALFDEMAGLALAQAEVRREVSTATAPAKATGVVLIGVPALVLAIAAGRGSLDVYLGQPLQRAAALVGLGLTVVGLSTSFVILGRSR